VRKGEGRLYGLNPVLEALRSGRPFNRIYLTKGRKGAGIREIIRLARAQGIEIRFTPKDIIDKIAIGAAHQGVVAFVASKPYSTLEDVLRIAKEKDGKPFLILLDGIEDPRNLGALVRVAEAGGVHGIILPERHSVGLTEIVAKTSAGALDFMPVVKVKNLKQEIDNLKRLGLWVIGADSNAEKNLYNIDLDIPLALVIGSEGKGLRKGIVESCDLLLSIPMLGRTTSLNVSVAAGVIIYEALRQRLAHREKAKNTN
jgi:23S rRNA (guanosine2251-2'-O)-methyltransferase